ncbi:hypothetical protein Ct9H90mP29_12360 [bacterium]|nr:MAG: hypothetical protein Ct9H90mP29_12360 [bacterium]
MEPSFFFAEGRLVNLGWQLGIQVFLCQIHLQTGHGQIALAKKAPEIGVYMLPKEFDEEVARLHLDHLGGILTELTESKQTILGSLKMALISQIITDININTI